MNRRVVVALAISGWALASIIGGAFLIGLRVNTTSSMPVGLWRITPLSSPPARGEAVVFCMPNSRITEIAVQRGYVGPGSCPNHTEPVLKPVAAAAGDVVEASPEGIAVNGALIPNSAAFNRDGKHRPLPMVQPGEYRVPDDEVWLVSDYNPRSFDSRYYGPVAVSSIIATATPLLTW